MLTSIQNGMDHAFVNGLAQNAESNLMVAPGNSKVYIGDSSSQNEFWDGQIREILIFDRGLTTEEHQKVLYYLGSKWDMKDVIDSDGDGFSDQSEQVSGTDPLDDTDSIYLNELPDFSTYVDDLTEAGLALESVEDDIVLWLDATNIDLKQNEDTPLASYISIWYDLSGNKNNAIQPIPKYRPQYITKNNALRIKAEKFVKLGIKTNAVNITPKTDPIVLMNSTKPDFESLL